MPADTAKYLEIASAIESQISAGTIRDGDALPSINQYADQHDISRSTVKRAYDRLCDLGLAISQPGKGYYVTQPENAPQEDSCDLRVFWSYAHKDDERTNGAITTLRKRIQEEYALQTGSEANIFQDTKDIAWGMDWRKTIRQSLGVTTFFIPVITPTYLRSPNCLAELRAAKIRFEELGFTEGIYPIEFVDSTKAIDALRDDSLATLLSNRQRDRRWIQLRLEDPKSLKYGQAVQSMVQTMIDKEGQWHGTVEVIAASEPEENEPKGLLDNIAAFDNAMSKSTETTKLVDKDISDIGAIFSMTEIPAFASAKTLLSITDKLSNDLSIPVDRLEQHCGDYVSYMETSSKSLDAIIGHYQQQDKLSGTSNIALLRKYHSDIKKTLFIIKKPIQQIESFQWTVKEFSCYSKAVRKPCKRIDAALSAFLSSTRMLEDWEEELRKTIERLS